MRLVYYTKPFFSDCDFPLIREFQKRGINMRVYIPIRPGHKRAGIIDLKKLKRYPCIYKASAYEEFAIYKDYVDLDKIYIINQPENMGGLQTRLLWLYTYIHILLFFPKIFHFNWQLEGGERWLYKLPVVKYMTVHDPISHSSVKNEWEEKSRLLAFKSANHYILLSDVLKDSFSEKYHIPETKIDIARMGEFSHLRCLNTTQQSFGFQYILFFGQILSYKGLEYLCEAMLYVNKKLPGLHMMIAGKGKMYFDYSKYEKLGFIHLNNGFIPIADLTNYIRNSLFVVCPYKDATQSGVVQTCFSCETPMIVTNVGALPKAVIHEETGLVVPPCDTDALAKAIVELASHPNKINHFRDNIISKWRTSMEWSSIIDIYIDAYNKNL